jgi:glycosyltransferase involved in cell wall biosynthesis
LSAGCEQEHKIRGAVIIPALNEAENLPRLLEQLKAVAGTLAGGFDVVVVDDGSQDETARVARDRGAIALRHPCNLGYGAAVGTGLRYAARQGYHLVTMMDADGQHDPADLPTIIEPILRGQADVVIGCRFLRPLAYRPGLARRVGMALFSRLASWLAGARVRDTTSGFQALDRCALEFLCEDYPADFPDAQVLVMLHRRGFRVAEVPITVRARASGVSMHSFWSAFGYPARMMLALAVAMLRLLLVRVQPRREQREGT